MGESGRKNIVVIVLSAVALIFFLLWLKTISEVSKQKDIVTRKSAAFMDLEEKNAKLEKERFSLSEELKAAHAQLAQEKAEHSQTEKTLSQEQVAGQVLKVELERVTRLKESLEKDIKEVLAPEQKSAK